MTTRKRKPNRYERVETNIRKVFLVYDDGTDSQPKYEVRVGGKRVGGHFTSKGDAIDARNKAQHQRGQGTLVATSAGKRTVLEVVDLWLAGSQVAELKATTTATYESIARHRLAPLHDKKVNKVSPAMVDAFKADLIKDGLAPLSVKKILSVLSFVMETAVTEGMIAVNPCAADLKTKRGRTKAKPKRVSIPEMHEVDELLDALGALDHPKAGEWSLYAEVAAYAGLRAGEICALRVRNVDPLARSIRVEKSVTDVNSKMVEDDPKSETSIRTVTEIPAELIQRLIAHVAGRSRNEYVFGDGVSPMRHKNFYRRVFVPTATAQGLPTLTFHQLRNFYASDLLRDPHLSVKDVAVRLGHADATLVLRTYGHLFADSGKGLGDRVSERRVAARKAQEARGNVVPITQATG